MVDPVTVDSLCEVLELVPAITFPDDVPVDVLVVDDEFVAARSRYSKVSLKVDVDDPLLVDEKSPVTWSPVVVTVDEDELDEVFVESGSIWFDSVPLDVEVDVTVDW